MKILRVRTHYGVPALKGENNWGAEDAGTTLRMVNGGVVISKYNKHVWIPAPAIVSADVEPSAAIDVIAEEKRGPGRPKKEQPSE